ncbi:MAG: LytR C-terminal domain-containing protein [Actinomycetes bacterium]
MFTPRGVGGRPLTRRSGASRRIMVVVAVLLVIVTGAWSAWQVTTGSAEDVRAKPTPSCPEPSPTPAVVPPAEVTVNVYNATDRRGLAARVAGELSRRGFVVRKIDNDPARRTVTGAAEVRHSAEGTAAARTVGAQVGEVVAVPDQRKGASVDLVLGAAFTKLLTPEQAAAAVQPSPRPLPVGCRRLDPT